jgi:hypothetical protein
MKTPSMTHRSSPFLFLAAIAVAASLNAGTAFAGVHTLWATAVPETSVPANTAPWNNESHATQAPTCTNCNTSACLFTTNSVNGNTTPLTATDFANFVLPPGERIIRVKVEVVCRYNENTSANLGFRAFAPNHGIDTGWLSSATFNTLGLGHGVVECAERLGAHGNITGIEPNWTAAKVNNLQFQVRRQAGLTNNTLRVLAMKVVVATEAVPTAPNTPSNLRATGSTANSISLAWNDNASNETGYVLQQLNPGLDPSAPGNWTSVNLPVNATSTTRSNLAGGTYRFVVRAVNAAGSSNASNTLFASTQAAPPPGNRFWINEIRTEGSSDYIEIAAPAGTVLYGQPGVDYALLQYVQTGAASNNRCRLETGVDFPDGLIRFNHPGSSASVAPNQMNGMGVVRIQKILPSNRAAFAFVRIVNGAQVELLDFVTHRGSSSATAPMTAEAQDPYLANRASSAIPYTLYGQGQGKSLRLVGSGCTRSAFQWSAPALQATNGTINVGQAFAGCP